MESDVSELAQSADRPQRGSNPRLETSATLVSISEVGMGGSARLLNLSTTGACVALQNPVERGQTLELKLAHPRLSVVPRLDGEVMWFTETSSRERRVGLRFLDVAGADLAVRPFLTAEAGSCLFQEQRLVGFVVPHGKARKAWSLFEASGKRLAVAALGDTGYEVHTKTQRAGSLPSFHAASLYEATCRSIGVEEPLRLEPPISSWRKVAAPAPEPGGEPPQGARADFEPRPAHDPLEPVPRDAPGRALRGASGSLGLLCEAAMPGSWLVVDGAGKQVAYLARAEETGYQICSMGDAIDDELEFRVFPDLARAAAVALGLGEAAGEVEIGELTTVGQITKVEPEESAAAAVPLGRKAVQVKLSAYETWKPDKPAQTRTGSEPRAKATKGAQGDRPRRVPRQAATIAVLALGVYLLYALWILVQAYTS
jgi:PilZ domain